MKFSFIKCYFILDQIKWLSFHTDEFTHLFLRFQTILFAHKCCVSKEEHFWVIYNDFSAFTLENIAMRSAWEAYILFTKKNICNFMLCWNML